MGYIKTQAEAKELLNSLEPFNAGSLTAAWERYDSESNGYVVRSYGVVIAEFYKTFQGLAVDAYSHSKTTSKHANLVRKAWSL